MDMLPLVCLPKTPGAPPWDDTRDPDPGPVVARRLAWPAGATPAALLVRRPFPRCGAPVLLDEAAPARPSPPHTGRLGMITAESREPPRLRLGWPRSPLVTLLTSDAGLGLVSEKIPRLTFR